MGAYKHEESQNCAKAPQNTEQNGIGLPKMTK